MCIFKSVTASLLIHPYLPFENQVPRVQKETVALQTNLMNNPAELLFKLYSLLDVWWQVGVQSQLSAPDTDQPSRSLPAPQTLEEVIFT